MYKLITSDMDETLLSDAKKITPKTEAAIKRATAAGVHFVPNTGRSFLSIQDNLIQMGLSQKEDQYVISYNGGAIIENKENKVLQVNGLPYEIVNQLFEIGMNEKACIHVYTVDELYIWNMNQNEKDYLDGRVDGWKLMRENNIKFLQDTPITKIIFNIANEAGRLSMRDYVESHVDFALNITFSSDRYIEFNDPTADKGRGTMALAKKLGIKPSEVIAIGDNSNDLPMIKAAGLGVSVANGRDFVKAEADYITQADNNHDAIAEVINKFIFNEEE
ncbi:haloacid dehalogenase [Ligilactobacillus salitolerans]|uniref:Haloacid dehalogenase n=1 Tax=Ligilactobacillus salitolerans TaxID=1808352 RepID=A0A401ISL0_9LACO|nr:Cof-type HAD-IIB family hydrolase [Ligilactobacillus salitolerans]GBG94519.1 haloacid dehalogenase [Ligilactobacillus salitolerans]